MVLDNVLNKTNLKLGGVNYAIEKARFFLECNRNLPAEL